MNRLCKDPKQHFLARMKGRCNWCSERTDLWAPGQAGSTAVKPPVSALVMHIATHAYRFRLDEAHVMVLSVHESVLIHDTVLA